MDSATSSSLTPPTPSWASAHAATSWATTWKKSFPRYPRAPESTPELSRVPESTRDYLSVSLAHARCTAAVSRHGVQQALPPVNDREARRRCAAASGRCLALTVRRPPDLRAVFCNRLLRVATSYCAATFRAALQRMAASGRCPAPTLLTPPLVPNMHSTHSPWYLTCT